MTDLLSRTGAPADRPDGRADSTQPTESRRPRVAIAAAAGLLAAAAGLLGVTVLVLLGWATAAHSASSASAALRTAGQIWLAAHHTGLALPHGHFGLAPLGLTTVIAVLLYRVGHRVAVTTGAGDLRAVARTVGALAVTYALSAALLSAPAASAHVRPSPGQAFVGGLILAAVAAGLGVLRGAGLDESLRTAVPAAVPAVLRAAASGLAVLLAGGALLVGVSLAVHLPRSLEVMQALEPGPLGGLLVLALSLAYLPTAVLWGSAFAVGPGFAVGADTLVAPAGITLADAPAFPLLTALPGSGRPPTLALLAVAVPFVAGAVAGALAVRALPSVSGDRAALWGLVSGFVAAGGLAILSALAGGPAGPGRMATLGPSAWQVGLVAALEVGTVAAAAAYLTQRRLGRRRPTS